MRMAVLLIYLSYWSALLLFRNLEAMLNLGIRFGVLWHIKGTYIQPLLPLYLT